MADEKPSLHIDLDWKKQAQEEKKRLEEEEKKRAEAPKVPAPVAAVASTPDPLAPKRGAKGRGQVPDASIQTIARTIASQAAMYMQNMESRGDEILSMDMAKHSLDALVVLEDKTKGNLTEDEQQYLNLTGYEARTRFISLAGQIIAGQG